MIYHFMDVLDVRVRGCGTQRFKSRGEEQIARLLDRNGINYSYEYPLAVIDNGMTRLWYPDFQLSGYGMIVEYFGVNGRQSYDEQARHKMNVYSKNGIEGLFLTEASFKGDWPGRIMGQIEGILKDRLDKFYNREPWKRDK
jgi:hypothetical protein